VESADLAVDTTGTSATRFQEVTNEQQQHKRRHRDPDRPGPDLSGAETHGPHRVGMVVGIRAMVDRNPTLHIPCVHLELSMNIEQTAHLHE